jgi:rubrerythrin
MPRRSLSERLHDVGIDTFIEPNKLVSEHLKNNYYDLLLKVKDEDTKYDCAICFENLLTCKRCFGLLNCGHILHTTCFLKITNNKCPCCRS